MADSKKASHTALMAAIHRFIATKEKDSYFKGSDELARIFLPAKVRFLLSFRFIRESVKKKMRRLVPGTFEYVTARTKFFDEQFKHSVDEDYPQVVLMGAGYDTRAFRYHSIFKNTKVFELDEPAIHLKKQQLLNKAGIKLSEHLTFVPINFNTDLLHEVLVKAGYEPSKKTLFLWEGVSMYLEEQSVIGMLNFISGNSAQGSRIVFDYFDKAIIEGDSDLYGAREISAEVKKSNEPFRFGIDPKKMKSFLQEQGLKLVIHLTPTDLEDNYLTNEKNVLFGHVYGFGYQVVAEV